MGDEEPSCSSWAQSIISGIVLRSRNRSMQSPFSARSGRNLYHYALRMATMKAGCTDRHGAWHAILWVALTSLWLCAMQGMIVQVATTYVTYDCGISLVTRRALEGIQKGKLWRAHAFSGVARK